MMIADLASLTLQEVKHLTVGAYEGLSEFEVLVRFQLYNGSSTLKVSKLSWAV